MKRTDLRVDELYAVVPTGPVRQGGSLSQFGAYRARLVELYDAPRPSGRFGGGEKLHGRVQIADESFTGANAEYDVSARRILGTWAERLEAEETDRLNRERWAGERAERMARNGRVIEALNARMVNAGLVDSDGEPMVLFSLDQQGNLRQRMAIQSTLRDLIERVTPEVGQ